MVKQFFCLLAMAVLVTACANSNGDTGDAHGASAQKASISSVEGIGCGEDSACVNVSDHVLFNFNQSDLTPKARATLDCQVTLLKKFSGVKVTVEGYSDKRGTREYNLALGERRAEAVTNYLVTAGISPDRIKTMSYGKERPAVLGSNEAAWKQNRRAVTFVPW